MADQTKAVTRESPRWATSIAELWPPQGEWTEPDYFALPDTNRIIELSEGELIMPPHPTETHQRWQTGKSAPRPKPRENLPRLFLFGDSGR